MTRPESPAPKTICLVDDDASVLKAVGRLLTSAGWVVRAFSEAAPFLAYASTNWVDLVVLDIWMSVFNVTANAHHYYDRPRRSRREVDRDPDRCGRLLPKTL
ncbi:MAG: hypothetical protein DMF22_03070 [Verrucomicrobia bacterium]|nr:MAG: hypothetical protein DMF22_03070 [Verrucomicrobiota bacterium]